MKQLFEGIVTGLPRIAVSVAVHTPTRTAQRVVAVHQNGFCLRKFWSG